MRAGTLDEVKVGIAPDQLRGFLVVGTQLPLLAALAQELRLRPYQGQNVFVHTVVPVA